METNKKPEENLIKNRLPDLPNQSFLSRPRPENFNLKPFFATITNLSLQFTLWGALPSFISSPYIVISPFFREGVFGLLSTAN